MKLRIRARTGQAEGAHAWHGISGRMRRLTATTLVLASTAGGLAAYGLTASASASVHTAAQAPVGAPVLITGKAANPTFFTGAGQVITYTFTVTNSFNAAFASVSLSDNRFGSICFIGDIPRAMPGMPVIRTCVFRYTTTVADVRAGGIVNTGILFVRGIRSGLSNTVTVPFRPTVAVTG